MQFNNIFILLIFCNSVSFAKTKLSEISTKQVTKNIRFLSSDGKFSYYTQRRGNLSISSNYSSSELLTNPPMTDYKVTISSSKKKVIIEVIDAPLQKLDMFKVNKIFETKYGSLEEPVLIGSGISAKLHFKDRYLSYFNMKKQEIYLKDVIQDLPEKKIKLNNNTNPFFVPQVDMPTPNDVIYTDLNSKGYAAALFYSLPEKKFETIYKARNPGVELEFCILENNIYIGEFPYATTTASSTIVKIPLYNNKNFTQNKRIYTSNFSDLGNMICKNNKIYFIKTIKYISEINLKETEVAVLDLTSLQTEILTNKKYITQIVEMDSSILVPFRGRTYVLTGKANYKDDQIHKQDKPE